jgi:mono/diheme cytochrome c family protein
MSRARWFIAGLIVGMVVIVPLGAYLFARFGGIAMATTAKPLPLEATFAKTALHASMRGAAKVQNPLEPTESNMIAGARVYVENCSVCHGLPGQPKTRIASGEFPPPPQLFDPRQRVTHDPQGVTHWKVAHGIRLSGMPGFGNTLTYDEQWQVTLLLAHADNLSATANDELMKAAAKKHKR